MGLLDRIFNHRIFNHRLKPSVHRRVCSRSGPMALYDALAVVKPLVNELDAKAGLRFITSGLDMQQDGRSLIWEFIFVLPRRQAVVMLSLEPDHGDENPDEAATVLVQRIKPLSPVDQDPPVLPAKMRNSPEVVSEFISRGVDFIAGPGDMKLESRVLGSGDAVWVTYYFDKEFTARF